MPDLSRYKASSVVKFFQNQARHVDQLKREALAMLACQGDRVVQLLCSQPITWHAHLGHGLALEMDAVVLCMPHYAQGDLFSFYSRSMPAVPVNERAALTLSHARMLVEAVAHVHSRGFLHRDIKPENCFLHDDKLFLGDFGYACQESAAKDEGCEGTLIYMAPEVAQMHP